MILKMFLNLLGITTFFWMRFVGRSDRSIQPSLGFWWKKNYEPLVAVGLIDVAMVVLLMTEGINILLEKTYSFLPEWLQLTSDIAIFYFTGLIFAWIMYTFVGKITEEKK